MFVSVVIPTYNRRPILEKCLDALEHQHLSGALDQYEVVLVDDGSTDGTPAWLRQEQARFSHVRLIEQEHGGPAAGRNRGVSHARGDVIVFIDSDLVVTASFTRLPVLMDFNRALTVLVMIFSMCLVSSVLAMRKLADADPAEIF
jgi:glycosyltransferase involved in cell wall biosynthesis